MIHRRSQGLSFALTLVALGAGLSACASERPTAELDAARQAINAAERSGAVEYAPVDLNNARVKLDRAQGAANQSENRTARRLAEEAQIDAEVAGAKAQTVSAQRALQQIREGMAPAGGSQPINPR